MQFAFAEIDVHLLDEALEVCAFMCLYAHVLNGA